MQKPLDYSRRTFLAQSARVGGILALPHFASLGGAHAADAENQEAPRRLVVLHNELSFYNPAFFPEKTGKDFEAPRLLKPLEKLRGNYTVFRGLDHPDVEGGHTLTSTLLTGINYEHLPNKRHTLSLDQYIADAMGAQTRFDKLVVGNAPISFDVNGTQFPDWIQNGREFYQRLFVTDDAERKRLNDSIARKRSILDSLRREAKALSANLNPGDQDRLDHYLTSIRTLETRMAKQLKWNGIQKPIPPEGILEPTLGGIMHEEMRNQFDMAVLALQTDSTRVMTVAFGLGNTPKIPGVNLKFTYHRLSHHGKEEEKVDQLLSIEDAHMKEIGRFLDKLATTKDVNGQPLLETTTVMLSSGMGNAHSHSNQQLPVLIAGGGFKHRGYVDLSDRDIPLCNLYVNFAQRMGLDCEKFASSNGAFTELS